MARGKDRAGIIIVHENQILLMYRKKGDAEYFCIPGGHLENGEDAETAALRELKEETTLDVELTEFMVELENEGRKETYFFAESFSGTPQLSGEEAERNSATDVFELQWIPIELLSNLLIYPEQLGLNLTHIIQSLQ